jgi:hypothetical protein
LSQVASGAPVGRDVEAAKREAQHKRIADSIVDKKRGILVRMLLEEVILTSCWSYSEVL